MCTSQPKACGRKIDSRPLSQSGSYSQLQHAYASGVVRKGSLVDNGQKTKYCYIKYSLYDKLYAVVMRDRQIRNNSAVGVSFSSSVQSWNKRRLFQSSSDKGNRETENLIVPQEHSHSTNKTFQQRVFNKRVSSNLL